MINLELKVPPVALAIIFAGAMWGASAQFPLLAFELPWRLAVTAGFVCFGVVLLIAGVVAFRRGSTTVNPTRPAATSKVVSTGIYAVSRNPMYLGLLLVLTGWAAFLGHILALLLVPAFVAYMNRFQITPEERALSSKFGPEFTAYRRSVRRWL